MFDEIYASSLLKVEKLHSQTLNVDAFIHVKNDNEEEIVLTSNADANEENDLRISTAEDLA